MLANKYVKDRGPGLDSGLIIAPSCNHRLPLFAALVARHKCVSIICAVAVAVANLLARNWRLCGVIFIVVCTVVWQDSGKTLPPYKSRKLLTFKHVLLWSLRPVWYLPGNNSTRAFPLNVAFSQKLFLHTPPPPPTTP